MRKSSLGEATQRPQLLVLPRDSHQLGLPASEICFSVPVCSTRRKLKSLGSPNSRSLKVMPSCVLCYAQSASSGNICPVTETERMLLSWSWAALGSSHALFTFPPTFPPEESSCLASLQPSQQKTRQSGMKESACQIESLCRICPTRPQIAFQTAKTLPSSHLVRWTAGLVSWKPPSPTPEKDVGVCSSQEEGILYFLGKLPSQEPESGSVGRSVAGSREIQPKSGLCQGQNLVVLGTWLNSVLAGLQLIVPSGDSKTSTCFQPPTDSTMLMSCDC